MGIAGELRQVLANLLANSLDAVGQDCRIVLRASASVDPNNGRRRIRITVADCVGMEAGYGEADLSIPSLRPRARSEPALGSGKVSSLLRENGGSIWVRSTTEGLRRGTTFSVMFPRDAGASIAAV